MAEPPLSGPLLFGASRRNVQAPNTFRPWQYVLIALVLLLGGLYAAPNLYQPDPAVQIRALDIDAQSIGVQDEVIQAQQALDSAGIPVIGTDLLEDGSALIRVDTDDNQLKAQRIITELLNAYSCHR